MIAPAGIRTSDSAHPGELGLCLLLIDGFFSLEPLEAENVS
jgi:hypothetical protein